MKVAIADAAFDPVKNQQRIMDFQGGSEDSEKEDEDNKDTECPWLPPDIVAFSKEQVENGSTAVNNYSDNFKPCARFSDP